MQIELIKAPQQELFEMLLSSIRPLERKPLEKTQWGAVGLIQAKLIDLYWAADAATKASNVHTALVMGSCPQHIQMLAVFGKQMAVETALDKVREGRVKRYGK